MKKKKSASAAKQVLPTTVEHTPLAEEIESEEVLIAKNLSSRESNNGSGLIVLIFVTIVCLAGGAFYAY